MSASLPIHVDDHGRAWKLANLKPAPGLMRRWRTYGDTPDTPLVPRSQWGDLIAAMDDGWDHPNLPYVHDQDGVGQCNCDATAALAEFMRSMQGLEFVKLSAADLYDRINGGGDNGSMLEDAMHEMLVRGIGTAATSGLIWHRGMHNAPDSERAKFEAFEVFICPTFDHVMSATIKGDGIVSGVDWYDNYKPDGDGWLPTRGSGGGGGHAVLGYKPAVRNGKFGIRHQNSWTPEWGVGGRCIFPEEMYRGQVGGWWALRQMVGDGDTPEPKK